VTQNNAVAKREVDPSQSLMKMINDAMPELRRVAPKYVNIQRMVSLAIEAKLHNSQLANCSPISVLNFCKKCVEAGTDRVGAGGMWPVPFGGEMVPIPDWRLLVEKAKKAKAIKHAMAEAVYEADEFLVERGMNPNLIHRPALANRGKIKAVYCVVTLPDDTKDFVVMDWNADVIPIRNRSNAWKSGKSNPWQTDEVEMGKKTVIKRTMKLFEGASIELTQLLEMDNVVNGYADATIQPEPIAMPKAIETTATEVPPPVAGNATTQSTSETPGEGTQEGRSEVRGVVEKITAKQGTKANGDPYTTYGVFISGERYGTFSNDLAANAKELEHAEVLFTWEQDGKFKNLKTIRHVPVDEGKKPQVDTATGEVTEGELAEAGADLFGKK